MKKQESKLKETKKGEKDYSTCGVDHAIKKLDGLERYQEREMREIRLILNAIKNRDNGGFDNCVNEMLRMR